MQWCFRFPVSAFPQCLRFDHIKMKFNPRQEWRVSYHKSNTLHHSQVTTNSYFTHWPIPTHQWSMGGTWVVMPRLGFHLYGDKIGKRQKKHTYICSRITTELHTSRTAYTIVASALILTENIYQILWIALALNTPDAILLLAVLQF